MFPWLYQQKPKAVTPRDVMLERLGQGVPPELAARAAGIDWSTIKADPEIDKALAEGEIFLFERARDMGVTGAVRAAQRHETRTWTPKTEFTGGLTLEDYLKD